MNDDFIKDMIDYGDDGDNANDTPEDLGSTRRISKSELSADTKVDLGSTRRVNVNDNTPQTDTPPDFEAAEIGSKDRADYMKDESSGYLFDGNDDDDDDSYFEDVPLPDETYNYDFEYDDSADEIDKRTVAKAFKPVVAGVAVFLIAMLVIAWIATSDNSLLKQYRKNFSGNAARLMDSVGISAKDDNSGISDSTSENTVEYKEVASNEGSQGEETVQYRTAVDTEKMIPFDGASDAQFERCGNGVVCAKTNYICYIDENGDIAWEKNVSITDPILKAEGNYFLIAQKSGTRFAMYKDGEAVFEETTEGNILTGNISANGDVVLVTDKPGYKGAVIVYNKNGDTVFSWSSGSSSIMSADISPNSRRVAVALLNVDSTVKSSVYLFNINKADSYARQELDNSIIYRVDFKGNNLNVFADTALIGMNTSGAISYQIDYNDSEPTFCEIDDNADKLIIFTGTNIPMINIYNSKGKLRDTISAQKIPGFAYVHDGVVTYSIGREIFMGKPSMKIPYRYTAVMDINDIIPIDDRSFMVVYSNSLAMVKMKGVVW